MNHNNTVAAQCFETRTYFVARTKIGDNVPKAVVLRHGMGRIRAARLATNMPLLLNWNTWVYEKKVVRWLMERSPYWNILKILW